jgi:sporulation related protein
VSRFLFFLLLLAVLALGVHLWLSAQAQRADFSGRERNPEEVRIVGVTPPALAARRAEETRRAVQSLAGAACVEVSGIPAADAPRAHDAFAALKLGDRLAERRIEEVSRYWVYVPATRDRRIAESTAALLRRQGVTELSMRPDNAISLGIFSTEDAARRFLASLQAKGVTGAEYGPFTRDLREMVFLVREPDTELVAKLTVMQREFASSQLRAVPCPAPETK